ncbi:MAG: hypothetical protein AAB553_04065 [Patescibacteria group bacterium]
MGQKKWDHEGNFVVNPGALKKYDTPRGAAKEYRGSSIIAFPSPEVQAVTGDLARGLMHRLAVARVDQYLGEVLPENTHHATITEAGHDMSQDTQDDIRGITRSVNQRLLEQQPPLVAPQFEIHGQPKLVGNTSIVLFVEPTDDASWDAVHSIGSAYYNGLHRLGGDNEIANRKPEDFVGHITLAYLAQNKIPPDDYRKIKKVLDSYKYDRLVVPRFPLDHFDLSQYDSMAEWGAPLARLTLPQAA